MGGRGKFVRFVKYESLRRHSLRYATDNYLSIEMDGVRFPTAAISRSGWLSSLRLTGTVDSHSGRRIELFYESELSFHIFYHPDVHAFQFCPSRPMSLRTSDLYRLYYSNN